MFKQLVLLATLLLATSAVPQGVGQFSCTGSCYTAGTPDCQAQPATAASLGPICAALSGDRIGECKKTHIKTTAAVWTEQNDAIYVQCWPSLSDTTKCVPFDTCHFTGKMK